MRRRKASLGEGTLILLIALFTAGSGVASAQISSAVMSGRVEDSSGAAIPAANMTITHLETGVSRTLTTDAGGNYRAVSLAVGQYEIKVEKPGFDTMAQTGINLVVGQQAVINFTMKVGQVQQEVTVTGEAPLVNTTTASVAGLVGEKQVKDLPLNGRSFDLLITLNPGSVNYSAMKAAPSAGAGEGNYFSVAGRRPTENMFLLNGVELTGASVVGITPGGVSGQLLGIDAVREFNVLSNAYSAEYGKRAGAQVTVVTQSGTNRFHGSAFEFLRNSKLDARNFFDKGGVPPFKRNQFGGSAGGPLRKDKTFIFGSYEGFRQRLGISLLTLVPDQNARLGSLPCNAITPAPGSCPASGFAPVPGLDPRMLPYLNDLYPAPNGQNLGGGIAQSFSNPGQTIREDFGTARFDQNFSSKDSLSVVQTIDDGYNLTPMADPIFGGEVSLRSQVTSAQETHIFSPEIINSFTAGFSRAGFHFNTPALASVPSSLSFVNGLPAGSVLLGAGSATGASALTAAGAPNNPANHFLRNLFTYTDGLQVIKGKHQISAGVWFQRIRSNEQATPRAWGSATFGTMQGMLQGAVTQFLVAPVSTPMAWRTLLGAWYVQDNIQLASHLNLSIGLRHEFTNGWSEATGRASNFVFGPGGVVQTDPLVGSSPFTANNAKWLFSPRVSLAWDPFGTGRTSIRAGFGTHYDLLDSTVFLLDGVAPYNGSAAFSNVSLFSIIPVAAGIPLGSPCGPGVPSPCTIGTPSGFQPNFKTTTVQTWNLTVEQQITPGTALRVGYVGSWATHEFNGIDPNSIHPQICADAAGCLAGGLLTAAQKGRVDLTVPQGTLYVPAGPGGAPNVRPNIYLGNGSMLMSEGDARYNALELEVIRRFAKGLQFRANYTWSRNLDMGSGIAASQSVNQAQSVMNPDNPQRDWGLSALHVKHQGGGNVSYELPFGAGKPWLNGAGGVAGKLVSGWQVNSIVTLLSGFPFTPQAGSNRSGNGDTRNPDRPSQNPAFSGPIVVSQATQWFNPNAFVLPTPGTWGNLGRGTLEGPGLVDVDFSIFKTTQLSERTGLQFRAEFFNLLNHTNLGTPTPIVFTGTNISPTAGAITSTATNSRQIQFGLKLSF
jgi:hypothetical protein